MNKIGFFLIFLLFSVNCYAEICPVFPAFLTCEDGKWKTQVSESLSKDWSVTKKIEDIIKPGSYFDLKACYRNYRQAFRFAGASYSQTTHEFQCHYTAVDMFDAEFIISSFNYIYDNTPLKNKWDQTYWSGTSGDFRCLYVYGPNYCPIKKVAGN